MNKHFKKIAALGITGAAVLATAGTVLAAGLDLNTDIPQDASALFEPGEMPALPDGEFENIDFSFDGHEIPDGEMPELPDGELPEIPDGEVPFGQLPPMFQNEDGPFGQLPPMLPIGEAPFGQLPPMFQDGEMPELPDGELPELADGELPDGELPELPDGELPELPDGEMPELPGDMTLA